MIAWQVFFEVTYRVERNAQGVDGLGVPLMLNLLLKAFLEA
jgi:hypothetical protein